MTSLRKLQLDWGMNLKKVDMAVEKMMDRSESGCGTWIGHVPWCWFDCPHIPCYLQKLEKRFHLALK
jgi:hypothetical protein